MRVVGASAVTEDRPPGSLTPSVASMSSDDSLAGVFRDLIILLEQHKTPYLVIGGMAQAVIGEPRLTQDLDCLISIPATSLEAFLETLRGAGFTMDRRYLEQWAQRLSDEAEEARMWHTLQRLLKEADSLGTS